MLEKPKRPKKIPNQDNKQPQTIQELIRRYDLDNTKIYDFLDEFVDSLNKKDTYSSEEQIVGRWIDGKPLYRKTIYSTNQVGIIDVDYDFIRYKNFNALIDNAHLLPSGRYTSVEDRLDFFVGKQDKRFAIALGSAWEGKFNYLVFDIEYTKTAD